MTWDSGKTASNVSQNVHLGADKGLTAATAYTWRVAFWDSAGAQSAWSKNASFSTGAPPAPALAPGGP